MDWIQELHFKETVVLTKKLFLDDIRVPREVYSYIPNNIYLANNWSIVRNYEEFVKFIEKNGLPDLISFDHDLADEHYVPSHLWDDYEKSKEYQDSQSYREKTGQDCAKWLVNYCIDNKKPLPQFLVHSMNPVGADYIRNYLNNYLKNESKNTETA